MRWRRPTAATAALLALLAACAIDALAPPAVAAQARTPANPSATSAPTLRWEPRRRVGLPEYAITLSAPVFLRFAQFVLTEPSAAHMEGGVLFDDAVRSVFVLDSRTARDDADLYSDVSWSTSMAYPFVDTLVTAWAVHGAPDVAWQMFIVSAQTMAITAVVTELTIHYAGRARPGQDECITDPDYSPTCGSDSAFHSLPSGHTAGAFAGASLTCAHHLELPLYGGGAGDVAACGLALAWASSGAIARLMADRHWASDVLLGAGLGLGLGWLLPELVYFTDPDDEDDGAGAILMPWAAPHALGLMGAARL